MRNGIKALLLICVFFNPISGYSWGFEPHRKINQWACLLLPSPLFQFYKAHIHFIHEHATDADMRRYIDTLEAPKHYIDLEKFKVNAVQDLPRHWNEAVDTFGLVLLNSEGQLPWNIYRQIHLLKYAFQKGDFLFILRATSDLGHYVADAHVPLHTTANYNGQLTGQKGIHALWETSVPSLFMDTLIVEQRPAIFHRYLMDTIFQIIGNSHSLVTKTLKEEQNTCNYIPEVDQWAYIQEKQGPKKIRSTAFVQAYHQRLGGMVEQQMKSAVLCIRDLIYTAWVMAGQPPLPYGKTQESKITNPELPKNCDH